MPGLNISKVVVCALALACASAASTRTYYRIETLAGSDPACDGCAALSVQLTAPQGIAVDRDRNVYIAVTDRHRIYRITPGRLIELVAGTGRAGMSGDGGPAAAAQLNTPYGLALDAAGNLYIADMSNHRVRRVGVDGVITTVAGTGEEGAQGDGGPATAAQLMSPHHLVFDGSGNLYISEFEGHRVRRVGRDGRIATVAGNGMAGLRGDGGPGTQAHLSSPAGLAVDPAGNLYIADTGNWRIRRLTPGGIIDTYWNLVGQGDDTLQPVGLAVDARGLLLMAARGIACVLQYNGAHDNVRAGICNQGGFRDSGNPETGLLSYQINDVAVGADGAAYIADGVRVRKECGRLETIAGNAYQDIGDNGPAAAAYLRKPRGLAMDGPGSLYIADSESHRVRKVTRDGTIASVAGNGQSSAVSLSTPHGVALGIMGDLFIADTGNNRVRQMLSSGMLVTALGSSHGGGLGADGGAASEMPLAEPGAVLADGRGTVYVADTWHHRVLSLDASGFVRMVAGNGSAGYSGDGGMAAVAQLQSPSGLALDAAGNLYIADSGNNAIRKVSPAGVIGTVLGAAVLATPRGVVVDGNGNLFIADSGHHVIRQLAPDGVLRTIAGTGAADFGGDGGNAVEAQFNTPWAVLVDGSGNLYVSDTGNNRVRKLTLVREENTGPEIVTAVVVNAASLAAGPVAPGELVSVAAPMEATLETGRVLFDGAAARSIAAQNGRITAQVPAAVASRSLTTIEVQYRNEARARATLAVAPAAPGLFAVAGAAGQAVASNADGSSNSAENPATRGSVITLYGTGEGSATLTARIGGIPAEVVSLDASPDLVGVFQIRLRIPSGFAPYGTLEVEVTAGSATSQKGIAIAVAP